MLLNFPFKKKELNDVEFFYELNRESGCSINDEIDEADTDSVNSNDSVLDGHIEASKEKINTLQMEIREIKTENLPQSKRSKTLLEEQLAAFKTKIGKRVATDYEIKLVRKEYDVKRLEGLLKKKEELKMQAVRLREKNDVAHMTEAQKDMEHTTIMDNRITLDKHLSSNRQNQCRPAPKRQPLKTTVVGTAVLEPSRMCTKCKRQMKIVHFWEKYHFVGSIAGPIR